MNMKRLVLTSIFITMNVPLLHAQFVSGRFVTSFYTWEKFDTVGISKTYLRAFQTAQLSLTQGDISLHTFLQGATNASNAFGDVGRVRFYNLYLTWSNIGKAVDLNLGRQAIYAGVGNGTIDGLVARAHFWRDKITLIGFGGATVNGDFTGIRKNIHDNYSVGGQLVTTVLPNARIGLSYMNKQEERDPYWTMRARDTTYNQVPYSIANDARAEQYGSADAYYTYETLFSVYGRFDYDFNLSKTSRGQGGARINLTGALVLTADYIYRSPRISYNSIFSAFTSNSINEIEGGLEYGFTPLIRTFCRIAQVSYTDDKSHRWTLGVNTGWGSLSYSGSDGYAGQLQAVNLSGAYPLFNNKLVPTLGLSYASYRLSSASERDNALSVALGAIVRPVNAFSFDVQGQWLANRIMNRDLRLQAKIMYWFAQRLSILNEEGK